MTESMIRQAIQKLNAREDLTRAEARAVMEVLLSGSVPDSDIVTFLAALRDKGEQPAELIGFAEVMRERSAGLLRRSGVNLEGLVRGEPLLDTCGTGGDGGGTFNVSTAAALVATATGVRVAKHGNRSISGRCGSADVLEALGVALNLPFERIPECLDRTGMVFLFAPHLHLAMKHVMNARRSLKTKTVFNLLGPLSNPLGATAQLVGVYDRARTEMMAQASVEVGIRKVFVVAGHDGLDEITLSGLTQISETGNGEVRTRDIGPNEFGLQPAPQGSVRGGDVATNARLLRCVLAGEHGPHRDAVLVNTSAALVAVGRASGFLEGVAIAAGAIDSGKAISKLSELVEFTRKHGR
jgi:anthranilate phosphoribosyltransferase